MRKTTDFKYYFLCYMFLIFAVIVVSTHLIPNTKAWHLIAAVLSVLALGGGFVYFLENR